ncbi:MAG: factor-independent urate hydroxylase [Frankia sp.]
MGIVLGPNRYGKSEVRLVHVERSTPRHTITDLTVSTALWGDFAAAHLVGDNGHVLTTDAQKNTIYAFARNGIGEIEEFGLRLARHFVGSYDWIRGARVAITRHGWDRIEVDGQGHDHAFSRAGDESRTTVVTVEDAATHLVSGLTDLVVLKSTGSEFHGFPRDAFTTLPETPDRILATAVTARWLYVTDGTTPIDYAKTFAGIRATLLETFASLPSRALQQTLYAIGHAVLTAFTDVAEIRLSMPNRHHFTVDLEPFGLDNPNVVFYAADRPYGLIEGTVTRDDAPDAGAAWD